jgi:transposase
VEHHAGIDVSLELSSVCVVDARGKIVREAKVASEPDALVSFFKGLGFPVKLIGLEAGPLSQWLHAGLTRAGFEAVLLATRHVKAALSAATVKTDRKDARGLARSGIEMKMCGSDSANLGIHQRIKLGRRRDGQMDCLF